MSGLPAPARASRLMGAWGTPVPPHPPASPRWPQGRRARTAPVTVPATRTQGRGGGASPLFSRSLPFAWDCLRCVLPTGGTAMCAWEEGSEPSLPSGTSASRGETPPRRGRPPSPGKCRSATSEHRPLPEATLTGPHARRGMVTATNCAHPPCGSTAARRADAAAAGAEARPLEAP